uniref:Ionotropic Receptor n=1 Tax=Epiphyas postvittana TaxID=65032 RepID=A0A0K8TUC9_EPIPO
MRSRLFILYLCFIHFAAAKTNPLLMPSEDSGKLVKAAECVVKMSAKYFVEHKALSGSIIIISMNSMVSIAQRAMIDTIHRGIKSTVMVKDSLFPHANASHFREIAKNYMFILESQQELTRDVIQLNKLPTWNPLAKAVVFYQLQPGEDGEQISIDFINLMRGYKLFKSIIFMFSPENEEVISYSWAPYSDTNCGGKCESVYILDKCTNGKVRQVHSQIDMFPLNMKQCPLVTYAVVSEPYVMPPVRKLTDTAYDDAYEFEKGGEIKLVKLISEFTNMSLIVRMSDVTENWGLIEANGTATGAFGVLRNDSVDLVIGDIEVTRTIRKWFHPTISYTQDEMTWCVPKSAQASTWNNLVIIFQWSTWVATFLSIVIMGLIFHYFYYRENNRKVTKWPTNSWLYTLSMLLGWGASFNPKSATFRILIFAWLFFGLIMGISYESFLRTFLMHPRYEKQISTASDLIRSEIPLGGRGIYRSYFETNNESSFYLYRKYVETSFSDGIRRAALGRNFAAVSSRRQAEYQDQKLGKGRPLLYCFKEGNNLYKYGVVLVAKRWYPMLDRLNNMIRRVSENGLIEKWNQELFIHSVSADSSGVVESLKIQHLLGAFMFIGLMYAFSVLVLIGELAMGSLDKRRNNKTKEKAVYRVKLI